MRRLIRVVLVCAAGLAAGSSSVDASQFEQPNVPGMPTQARMVIINSPAQPVPVVVAAGGDVQPVTMIGTPSVSLVPGTVVAAQTARQGWEYRTIQATPGQDPTSALNVAGVEGWEAVGIMPGGVGSTQILLKRPR